MAWRAAAIDIGAESGRVIVGQLEDGRLDLDEVHRFPNAGVPLLGHLYWDVLRLIDEARTGLERAGERHGEIASAGVATWGVDFGLLDASGALLQSPSHYRDRRTEGVMEQVLDRVPADALFRRTGVQPARINTLFQLLALVRSGSGVLERAERLLMMPDLFHYFLSGERAGERTIATTSQAYDAVRDRWASELFDELGLPSTLLPPVVPSGTVLGPLVGEARRSPGLARTVVIAPASHDTASAVAAIPARADDYAFISSGTWSVMGVVLPRPLVTEPARTLGFTNEGGVAGTTRLLRNITGLWLVQRCRDAWARAGSTLDYAALTALAEKTRSIGSIVDPDHPALVAPDDMPAQVRALCKSLGQAVPADHGALLRVLFESLACRYRRTLEQLEAVTGRELRVVHIVGGGSQNRLLCQLTADTCARPVLAGPVESTASGNVLVQALAAGVLASWSEVREVARRSAAIVEYEPHPSPQTEALYARFCQQFS